MVHLLRSWVLVLLLASLASAQTLEKTRRGRNDAREGPGNYYPLVCILPEGASVHVLRSVGAWKEIRLVDPSLQCGSQLKDGKPDLWLSRSCFTEKKGAGPLEGMAVPCTSLQASPSGVAAAVRGFALRYSERSGESPESVDVIDRLFFTPEKYEQFRRESESLRAGTAGIASGGEADSCSRPYDLSVLEEAVGLGVAVRLAGTGLVEDQRLLEYVNLLATYLSEHSGAFDVRFRVLVLRGADPYAMSVPGGFIFLSQGIIDFCRDEAELAGLLAHEMMHVILGHGLKEIEKRPVQIRADMAMAELESRVGGEPDPVKLGLEDFAQEAYEMIQKPRLQAYELGADRCALILLAESGYDPAALLSMIACVRDLVAQRGKSGLSNPFLSMDFQDRYEEASRVVGVTRSRVQGVRNRERFVANLGQLDQVRR